MAADMMILGKRIRFYRLQADKTLEQLSESVGVVPSQLSLIENGKREPKLSLLNSIAQALGVSVQDLLSTEAPDRRSELEIELDRLQTSPIYTQLALPHVRSSKGLSDEALEAIVGLHKEMERQARLSIATPEEARRANVELQAIMREENNYLPEIDELAEEAVKKAGHESGALMHRTVAEMAKNLGFELIFVDDLPSSARSITDLANGRIYLPPASIPGGHGLRAMALQAIAHRLLGHEKPSTYAEFLKQRLDINYFAAACLMPRARSVAFLQNAKKERNIAIEDFRDAFGVTHEAAALRFTNLATEHLSLKTHFLRVNDDGGVFRGYENDGLKIPADVNGSIEGQEVCRKWPSRKAFQRTNRTNEFYQYTDTPSGTFWDSTQTGTGEKGEFSISVGVPFDDAKWFRGRDTERRETSTCPSDTCCKQPQDTLTSRWSGNAWPSARMHAHVLSPLPSGNFPGVNDVDLYEFLEKHANARG
jgi:transcriptional regulator with XRE-family HTH domain/predicted transcriptional regulator